LAEEGDFPVESEEDAEAESTEKMDDAFIGELLSENTLVECSA
jgi:hypothetical protein